MTCVPTWCESIGVRGTQLTSILDPSTPDTGRRPISLLCTPSSRSHPQLSLALLLTSPCFGSVGPGTLNQLWFFRAGTGVRQVPRAWNLRRHHSQLHQWAIVGCQAWCLTPVSALPHGCSSTHLGSCFFSQDYPLFPLAPASVWLM